MLYCIFGNGNLAFPEGILEKYINTDAGHNSNALTHAGHNSTNYDLMTYLLKKYVKGDRAFGFCLGHPGPFLLGNSQKN